jgi:hypothetical protein
MTTDSDEVHGTVIDPGYSAEPESASPGEPEDALDGEREPDLSPADSSDENDEDDEDDDDEDDEDGLIVVESYVPGEDDTTDAPDAEATGLDTDDEDEDDEDDEDGLIVVESYVPGEDDRTDAPDAVADEAAGLHAADAEADEAADLHAADDEADEQALPVSPDVTDDEAAPAPTPAHSRVAADSQLGGDAGLAGGADEMYQRWAAIQSGFVDDPRESVTEAAAFLSEVMTALLARVREREQALRDEWDRDDVDTEGLRMVLRRYRAFLDRLAAL